MHADPAERDLSSRLGSLPTRTYNPEGEGRASAVSDSTQVPQGDGLRGHQRALVTLGLASAEGAVKSLGGSVLMQPGSSDYTSALSCLSSATRGPLRGVADFAAKWAGPVAIATAVIDPAVLASCAKSD